MKVKTTRTSYSIGEVARILGVHPSSVSRAVADGRLKRDRPGQYCISAKQVEKAYGIKVEVVEEIEV